MKERSGEDNQMKMGGTGSAQEDQIITVQLEQALGVKFTYVPFKGGGEVCVNLVGKHVDSTVNNPIECASHWKAGRVRPLAVFDTERIPSASGRTSRPSRRRSGADIHYLMLRGIFGAARHAQGRGGVVRRLAQEGRPRRRSGKKYMDEGALKPAFARAPSTSSGWRRTRRSTVT